ncbi:12067_t:CDS:2 [Gigaspora margarita]|uniref:12067_t:CDS:1 n=1 Tax=Gigaspora margarita TaxID=4874 RepID=A0ABN7USU2_GIGMA|nr:12067_t:CDS:2 [Gigaspora margarita]
MSDRYQTVLADIFQTEPQVVTTILYPTDTSMPLITRVTKTYTKLLSVGSSRRKRQLVYAYYLGELLQEGPETPEELRACRKKLTTYYYKVAIRTYNIFKDLRVNQLQRTTKTTLRIIKELPEMEYQALKQRAISKTNKEEGKKQEI